MDFHRGNPVGGSDGNTDFLSDLIEYHIIESDRGGTQMGRKGLTWWNERIVSLVLFVEEGAPLFSQLLDKNSNIDASD